MAEKLFVEFGLDLGDVTLAPGLNGIFDVSVDGKLVFSKDRVGRFPEFEEIRDQVRAVL